MMGLGLALLVAGSATFYADGVMNEVYANRLAWGHVQPCTECVGMVAMIDRQMLGQQVWLQRSGLPPEGPFLVVDCAAKQHRGALVKRGLVAEVDWQTAQRWGMRAPVPVSVLRMEDGTHLSEVRSSVPGAGLSDVPPTEGEAAWMR